MYKGDQMLFSMRKLALMYAGSVYQIRHVFQQQETLIIMLIYPNAYDLKGHPEDRLIL